MALPKEPRQKMINLMYLVLTALLALNVSSEILNAFRTVNNSLNNATANIEGKNIQMFNSFEDMKKDEARRVQAEEWEAKANKAKALADGMNNYIVNLQTRLRDEADYDKAKGTYNEGSLEAATRLMDEKGEGPKLLAELTKYKDALLKIDPKITAEVGKTLPIDLSMPKVQDQTNNTWTAAYFRMTPAIAAMTILSKFQNDVKNSESQVVEYCLSRVGRVIFNYDQFQVIANASATYLMPGEDLSINAGIGAYSSKATPNVTVNGASAVRTPQGDYEVKTKAETSPGQYVKHVVITYTDPNDGKVKTVTKDIKYTVGSPTGATVSADAVKVLYIGLDNPISVSGGNVGDERIGFNMDNGSFTKDKPGHYIVRPGRPGTANITLTIDGKPQVFPFRVKSVPDPVGMVGASKGGPTRVNDFKAQAGVRAELENFVFEGVQFNVTGYTIVCQGAGFSEGLQFRQVNGATFNSVRDLIEKCRPGSAVTIDEIKVTGPGGSRTLPPIQFNLRP